MPVWTVGVGCGLGVGVARRTGLSVGVAVGLDVGVGVDAKAVKFGLCWARAVALTPGLLSVWPLRAYSRMEAMVEKIYRSL